MTKLFKYVSNVVIGCCLVIGALSLLSFTVGFVIGFTREFARFML